MCIGVPPPPPVIFSGSEGSIISVAERALCMIEFPKGDHGVPKADRTFPNTCHFRDQEKPPSWKIPEEILPILNTCSGYNLSARDADEPLDRISKDRPSPNVPLEPLW